MVTSLFKHQRIKTTDAKAKELRRWADRLITLAKRGDLHARRQALAIVREKDVVHKLFEDAPNRFGKTSGGYTRVIKIGRRAGDAARVSIVELVSPKTVTGKPKKKPAKKKEITTAPKVKVSKSETEAEKEIITEAAEESKDQAAAEVTAESAAEEKVTEEKKSEELKDSPTAPGKDGISPEKSK
jgi:large subunit ribosomal protein L17